MSFRELSLAAAVLWAALAPLPVSAYEVDDFTGRERAPADSLAVLDGETNRRLDLAFVQANEQGSCDPALLYEAILKQLGGNPKGEIERFAQTSDSVARSMTPLDWSVYAGVTYSQVPILAGAGIEASVTVAGHRIGADKLGHFVAQGYDYFRKATIEGRSEHAVLEYGIFLERTIYGTPLSGVMSYGDLSANYAGFKFWSSVLGGPTPYARCENGRFVRTRPFTWEEQVTDAWDEGINCSVIREDIRDLFDRNLIENGVMCPVDPEACRRISRLENAAYFVSPACLRYGGVPPIDADAVLARSHATVSACTDSAKSLVENLADNVVSILREPFRK